MVQRKKHDASEALHRNLEVHKTTLPGGLRVITERIPHLRSVSLGAWILRGSRHDPGAGAGTFHFLEHTLFKGTESHDALSIARLIDSIGGHVDAFTSKEHMCYHARVLDEFVPQAVGLLAEIILAPTFPPHELERERGVILEEIKMYEDTPDDLVHSAFVEHHWQGHPLASPILGTRQSVGSITADTLRDTLATHVTAPNLVVAAAGNLEHDEMLALVTEAFHKLGTEARELPAQSEPVPHTGLTHKKKQGLSQAYLCLGLPGYRRGHEERYALSVLNGLTGTGLSSRLYQKVREELGLAYDVYSDAVAYSDSGYWLVYAGTDTSTVSRVVEAVLGELDALKAEPPREDELLRAKNQIRSSALLGLESTSHRMASLALQEMEYGRQISLKERLERVAEVSGEDVLKMAHDLFRPERLALSLVSSEEEPPGDLVPAAATPPPDP